MSFFEVKHVCKTYPDQLALEDISFQMQKGEVMAMIGESGSGKSTLLRILAGLEVEDSGEVLLKKDRVRNPNQRLIAGHEEIKLVHQDNQLYPNSTVSENIRRPLLLYDKTYAKARVQELLELFALQDYSDRYPRQLSGGQQQKVAIAAALATEPEILLLDEAFSSLDRIQINRLLDELAASFRIAGTTVIFVTHDLDQALRLTDQLYILRKGKIIQGGKPEDLYRRPASAYVAELFTALNSLPDVPNAYLRPSSVSIHPTDGWQAEVIDARYLVRYNRLLVKLKGCEKLWELDDAKRTYKKGEKVNLIWDKEAILTIPRD